MTGYFGLLSILLSSLFIAPVFLQENINDLPAPRSSCYAHTECRLGEYCTDNGQCSFCSSNQDGSRDAVLIRHCQTDSETVFVYGELSLVTFPPVCSEWPIFGFLKENRNFTTSCDTVGGKRKCYPYSQIKETCAAGVDTYTCTKYLNETLWLSSRSKHCSTTPPASTAPPPTDKTTSAGPSSSIHRRSTPYTDPPPAIVDANSDIMSTEYFVILCVVGAIVLVAGSVIAGYKFGRWKENRHQMLENSGPSSGGKSSAATAEDVENVYCKLIEVLQSIDELKENKTRSENPPGIAHMMDSVVLVNETPSRNPSGRSPSPPNRFYCSDSTIRSGITLSISATSV